MITGRRNFIKTAAISSLALTLPKSVWAAMETIKKPVKVGLIADLHQDVMHDGLQRMQAFVDEMKQIAPDAILQMGDFAYPGDKNKAVIELFNNAHSKAMHVIGNHDTDAGYTKQQCLDYWGMPARYYVEQIAGVNFIVLDGNDKGSPVYTGGYVSYIGEEQWTWLIDQLNTIDGPVVIVSHQPLAGAFAIDNAEEIQDLLGRYSDKILLAINGHSHIDSLLRIKKVAYLHINSASYVWLGGDYKHESYSKEIHEEHPYISYTSPYRDALFSTMVIDPDTRTIKIIGKQSEWVGKSPSELGADVFPSLTPGEEVAPRIRNRSIESLKIN